MKRSVQYLLTVGIIMLFCGASAGAASTGVVISHIQAGAATGTSPSGQEFVVVYNNSDLDVEVTDWCVTNKSGETFACLLPVSPAHTLHLSARGYMIVASSGFARQFPAYQADLIYTASNAIVAGADTITLVDSGKIAVDAVSWTSSLSAGTVMQRQTSTDPKILIDTEAVSDFVKTQGVELPPSSLYEVVVIIDECTNIPESQQVIPVGYLLNEYGECIYDECINLPGLQAAIPEEFLRRGDNECMYDYVKLQITELLPNVAGSDVGREYIEIHNPTDRDAFLLNYFIKIGDKTYTFPSSLRLGPGEYMAFYNTEMAFTLLNTTSDATLLGDDDSVISQTDIYSDPKEDMAWSWLGGVWQYTNQLTFGAANAASIFEQESDEITDGLQPCAANQYRHPETNRCRLLVTTATTVMACKDGQYRSEETNRCRTIALAGGTLTPCKDGQYRNEETNRCRNLATLAGTLVPCKDDQYRSEETNRCRNILSVASSAAAFPVEPVSETASAFVGWYVLGVVIAIALGYGVWEWRYELTRIVRHLGAFFTQR